MDAENKRELELLAIGKECYEKGMANKALSVIGELAEGNSKNPEVFFLLGNIFCSKGEVGKSIKAFKKVLELSPDHTDASISLSILYNDIGKYEEAKQVFDKARKKIKGRSFASGLEDPHINKKFSLKHYELGGLYLTYNRLDEAMNEYSKAFALDPENFDSRIQVAKIYAKKGFILKAIEELKKLKNEQPQFLPTYMALGILYFGNGHIIEAQTEWRKVLSKDPHHQEAGMYLNLSQTATETNLQVPETPGS